METITDWGAFDQGWKAWDKLIDTGIKENNPYKKETALWKSWNQGYNLNTKGVFDEAGRCV